MSKMKILATRKFPEAVEKRLIDTFETKLNEEDKNYSLSGLIGLSRDVDGILCAPGDQIGADLINALPDSVKIIATFSVGYEHVDVNAAKERSIVVTNTPGVLSDATADIAMLLMLGATRRAFEGELMIRQDTWEGWTPTQLMGVSLQGRRLGILGMGGIGQAVAKRAQAFGMKVYYYNRRRLPAHLGAGAAYCQHLDALLSVSDVLSIHCPLTPETHHLLNEENIAKLPKGAVVINTARGPVVKDEALIEALKSGHVRAAGLDVFEGEPDINPAYRLLPNTFLLPHLGSATVETRNAMGFCAIDNLEAYFKGHQPPNRVV